MFHVREILNRTCAKIWIDDKHTISRIPATLRVSVHLLIEQLHLIR